VNEVVVQAYGLRYVVDEGSKFIVEESYEPFMKDLVKLDSGDVFIDVGAHVGKYSFYAAKQVGDSGLVIAIEPYPRNFENLKKGIELNGFRNIKVAEKACSNRSGKAFLLEYELSAKNEIVDKPTKMLVDVDTLDHIIENLQINRVNMVKIDVNGHEYQVIEGSRNTLKNCKPTLLMEVMLENKQSF
jgi:FkbM family methyltransferase